MILLPDDLSARTRWIRDLIASGEIVSFLSELEKALPTQPGRYSTGFVPFPGYPVEAWYEVVLVEFENGLLVHHSIPGLTSPLPLTDESFLGNCWKLLGDSN